MTQRSDRKENLARKGLRDILLSVALISVVMAAVALNIGAIAAGLMAGAAAILTFLAGSSIRTAD